jgi:hypothetical protein
VVQGRRTNHYASDHTSALTLEHLEARAFMLCPKSLSGCQLESTKWRERRFRALLTEGCAEQLELARL